MVCICVVCGVMLSLCGLCSLWGRVQFMWFVYV